MTEWNKKRILRFLNKRVEVTFRDGRVAYGWLFLNDWKKYRTMKLMFTIVPLEYTKEHFEQGKPTFGTTEFGVSHVADIKELGEFYIEKTKEMAKGQLKYSDNANYEELELKMFLEEK